MIFLKKIKKSITDNSNTSIIMKNTFLSFVIKGGSMIVALFTTPAYIKYFNNNQILGVWFTILSVLAWILNCDMGIGNGLRNHLVYSINERDWDKSQKYISSSYYFLSGMGMIVLICVILIGKVVSWNKVFNISDNILKSNVLNTAVLIVLASIILQFVLRLVTSILYAIQEAFVPGLLNLATNLILLIVVSISNYLNLSYGIVFLAWIYLLAVNIPLIIATIWVFSIKLKQIRPKLNCFRMDYAKEILKVGGVFLWLQLVAMIIDNTNSYLIALFINNSAVVEYQFYYKIFNIPMTAVLLLSTSLWSTVTKAKAEDDWEWLQKCYKKFLLITVGLCLCEFLIIPPLQIIFNIWLGESSIKVSYTIAIIFAISGSVMIFRTILSCFSNGLCELKIQIIFITIGAVINIPLAYIFAHEYHHYIAIVIANILSMIPYCIVQMLSFRKLFNKNNYKIN